MTEVLRWPGFPESLAKRLEIIGFGDLVNWAGMNADGLEGPEHYRGHPGEFKLQGFA